MAGKKNQVRMLVFVSFLILPGRREDVFTNTFYYGLKTSGLKNIEQGTRNFEL